MYFSPRSDTTPRRASGWHWTRFSTAGRQSPGLPSERLVSRCPRAALTHGAPGPSRPFASPWRHHLGGSTGGQSSSDARPIPSPARARSNPAPAAARPAAVRPVYRPGSCHSPDWPGQRAPTAPHGSWAPRASRFLPAPWQAAQVAEPRSSGPAPAARSSSRRCPLGTDQQQDGGQPRGRGPGVIVTRAAKNPPPAEAFPNQQPRCPTPWGVLPTDR